MQYWQGHIVDELLLKVHFYLLTIVFGMCCQRGRSILSCIKNFKDSKFAKGGYVIEGEWGQREKL